MKCMVQGEVSFLRFSFVRTFQAEMCLGKASQGRQALLAGVQGVQAAWLGVKQGLWGGVCGTNRFDGKSRNETRSFKTSHHILLSWRAPALPIHKQRQARHNYPKNPLRISGVPSGRIPRNLPRSLRIRSVQFQRIPIKFRNFVRIIGMPDPRESSETSLNPLNAQPPREFLECVSPKKCLRLRPMKISELSWGCPTSENLQRMVENPYKPLGPRMKPGDSTEAQLGLAQPCHQCHTILVFAVHPSQR